MPVGTQPVAGDPEFPARPSEAGGDRRGQFVNPGVRGRKRPQKPGEVLRSRLHLKIDILGEGRRTVEDGGLSADQEILDAMALKA